MARLLIEKFQRENPSIDQICELVQTIYRYHPSGSNQPYEEFRLLIEKLQPDELLINQLLKIAHAFSDSSIGSDVRCEVIQWLIHKFQPEDLSIDQALQIALAIYQCSPDGSKEKRKGGRLLNELVHHNKLSADQADTFYQAFIMYEEMRQYDDAVPIIPAIVKLAMQDTLSLSIRERFYRILQRMVPLFVQIDSTQVAPKMG
jgi:hypothetical protein